MNFPKDHDIFLKFSLMYLEFYDNITNSNIKKKEKSKKLQPLAEFCGLEKKRT